MKLTTQNGELELPSDFSFTMERTNPLLSGDGDATIPATLPSSPNNLAVLRHLERIDRLYEYDNQVEAILYAGPVQKHGRLVIDTVHRRDGICASFAVDSSDLYVKSKGKTLKEIFAEWNNGEGYQKAFNTVDEACGLMQEIYELGNDDGDYLIFPVAIAPYETGDGDEKETVYQFNNEDENGYLVWGERVVKEGDVNMLVPKGYGIAPFLKLNRLLLRLFECLGYTVTYNCFDEQYYDRIVIVHNCSDCLVRPFLLYEDLVPSCTLGEFLDWLLAKFHVQPVVDSQSKQARIVRMDEVLEYVSGHYDMDITPLVEGDWTVQVNPSKRIVLTPTCEIEGTEPAAETFDKLLAKYNFYVKCNERQFASIEGDNPAVNDCLVQRKATGEFYLIERRVDNGKAQLHRLGTNYFTYDRNNSDDTEAFSQVDVMPLMWVGENFQTAPFIGERIHRHTSYQGKIEDIEQKIIAVQAVTRPKLLAFSTTATTQDNIPEIGGYDGVSLAFGLDNYSLYGNFRGRYNAMLLHHEVHLSGKVRYDIGQFLSLDMTALKLCNGARLLPVKASMQIGGKPGLSEVEFINTRFASAEGDHGISPSQAPDLRWERATLDENDNSFDEDDYCRDLCQTYIIAPYPYGNQTYIGYEVEYEGVDGKTVWLGTPLVLGEQRIFVATAHYKITYEYDYTVNNETTRRRAVAPSESYPTPEDFDKVVKVIFTAIAV